VPGGAPSKRNKSPSIDDGCCGLLTGFFRLSFHHPVCAVPLVPGFCCAECSVGEVESG